MEGLLSMTTLFTKVAMVVALSCSLAVIGCKSWNYQQDGKQLSGHAILGIPIISKTNDIVTIEEKRDQLEWQAKMDAKQSQERIGFWTATFSWVGALACFLAGVMTKGWKFFGTLTAGLAVCAVASLMFSEAVQYLRYATPVLLVVAVLYGMYRLRQLTILNHEKGV